MSSEELPPKEPALFALAVLVQAWFLVQKPKLRTHFLRALRKLIATYRAGNGVMWRPGMTAEQVRSSSRTTTNWLEALANLLEQLTDEA